MIRLLMAGLLLVSFNTLADTQVTNKFEDGDIIEAEKFNKNFDDLEAAIDSVETAIDSVIADPFAALNCTNGQSLRRANNAWACISEPITASLVKPQWTNAVGCRTIVELFDSYNNVNLPGVLSCDPEVIIQVLGITDHSGCVTTDTGAGVANQVVIVDPDAARIRINARSTWNVNQPVYINISCPVT